MPAHQGFFSVFPTYVGLKFPCIRLLTLYAGIPHVCRVEVEAGFSAMQLEMARYENDALNHMTDYRFIEALGLDESLVRYIRR